MVGFLGGRTSHRKLWLFGCASCRRIWHLLPPAGREAVAAGELYADGDIAHGGLMDASLKNYRDADATGDELTIQAAVTANLAVVDPSRNGLPSLTVEEAACRTAEMAVPPPPLHLHPAWVP